MLPFRGNFTEALGTEFDLQGFTIALHAVIDEHEQGVFATLGTLDPELEDAFFQVRGQVDRTSNTNSHTGIVACDKLDLHGKGSFHSVLIREDRFGVFARILVGISTATGNGFTHNDAHHVLVGAELFGLARDEAGIISIPVIAE